MPSVSSAGPGEDATSNADIVYGVGPMRTSRTTWTKVLPNGNRVTISVGVDARGFAYKTVKVKYRDGSTRTETYRQGIFGAYLNNQGRYLNDEIPKWALG